jgi:hypothetical protein
VIGVLVSIYCDYKDKNSSSMLDSPYITKSTIKNDISCDVIRGTNHHFAKSNNSFADVSKNKYIEIKDQFLNNSHYTPNKINYTTYHNKIDNTILYNENYKSPDHSQNLFSPYSYRLDEKSHIEPRVDSQLEAKINELNINSKEECIEVYRYIKERFSQLKGEQDRNSRILDEINREKESKFV